MSLSKFIQHHYWEFFSRNLTGATTKKKPLVNSRRKPCKNSQKNIQKKLKSILWKVEFLKKNLWNNSWVKLGKAFKELLRNCMDKNLEESLKKFLQRSSKELLEAPLQELIWEFWKCFCRYSWKNSLRNIWKILEIPEEKFLEEDWEKILEQFFQQFYYILQEMLKNLG